MNRVRLKLDLLSLPTRLNQSMRQIARKLSCGTWRVAVARSDFGSRRVNRNSLSKPLLASHDNQSATSEVFYCQTVSAAFQECVGVCFAQHQCIGFLSQTAEQLASFHC